MVHLFTRTTGDGRVIEGHATFQGGMKTMVITVDGTEQRERGRPGIITSKMRRRHTIPNEYTHTLAGVALTPADMEAFEGAEVADGAALVRQRAALVSNIQAIETSHDEERATAWDAEDMQEAMADDSPELLHACEALAAFDRAHPHVREAQNAAAARAAERQQWH